ncbi:MAG: hypothetical protein FJ087_07855 [Deltaproteobacteria bacterium]|nr:hypothetical protein [Deltaproteobacteria bacterium]
MTRQQLEHIIRASAQIADDDDIVVIGSQAVLGQYPVAPADLRVSMEADVYPRNHPERADLIDGSIGEASPFHDTFGYYAQGVGENTATLPAGWKERLIPVCNANTRGATGWCLEVHDLCIAKLVAGREKDLMFLESVSRHRMADPGTLRNRLGDTTIAPEVRSLAEARLRRIFLGA